MADRDELDLAGFPLWLGTAHNAGQSSYCSRP
jgi:hypothetical protein